MTDITIPYAIADFADLRQRGFYYVDKTRFIPELERYNAYRMRSYVVYMAAGKVCKVWEV